MYQIIQTTQAISFFLNDTKVSNYRAVVPSIRTAAVAQWVRALALHAEDGVFESQPRQTNVVKTGSDSSIAKRLALGVNVTGPRR